MIRIIRWYHAVYDLSRYVATVKVRIKANVKIFIPWQTLLYIKWNNITTIICKLQKVISVTDGRGNTVNYSYDKEGQQITEKDALGSTCSRTYDENGNFISETD